LLSNLLKNNKQNHSQSIEKKIKRASVLASLLFFTTMIFLSACEQNKTPSLDISEKKPGGNTTTGIKPFPSFQLSAKNLPRENLPKFHAGKALANQPWIKAPTITTARDGLGPLYNSRSCLACHKKGGKGRLPKSANHNLIQGVVRLSLPGTDKILGVVPEPNYGDQLQTQSVSLSHQLRDKILISEQQGAKKIILPEGMPAEARIKIEWQHSTFEYPDGKTISLRRPTLKLTELAYGPLHPTTVMSLRMAPAIHGTGLLELIPQNDIDTLADPEDRNNDGISGRVNRVWNPIEKITSPGRFGWKASRHNVEATVAAAFTNDIGITNPLYPLQPCTAKQILCLNTINGNDSEGVELPKNLLALVANFVRNIGVPVQRPLAKKYIKGRELFYRSTCNRCHKPQFITASSKLNPHLSQQTIWPYTDLLLHDMGPELADGRSDFQASGSEWRTAPLWGAGLNQAVNGSKNFLHDGRAKNIEEAILWHGGEAHTSRDNFTHLDQQQRQALIEFVKTL